jgi:hypothetical protein
MLKYFLFFISVITLGLALSGCPNTISNPKDIIFPDSNVSYTRQVEPFLNLTCAFSGCHGNTSTNGIILNDYFRIVNTPGLVIAGKPDASLLIQIIEKTKPHFTYYEESNITENHKKGMRRWVQEGARLIKD